MDRFRRNDTVWKMVFHRSAYNWSDMVRHRTPHSKRVIQFSHSILYGLQIVYSCQLFSLSRTLQ